MTDALVNVEIGMSFDPDAGRWDVYGTCEGECQLLTAEEARELAEGLRRERREPTLITALFEVADQVDALNRPRN